VTDVESTGVGTVTETAERSDEQLLEQIARGEPDALATLYDRYHKMSYSLAVRVTGDVPLAEDVVQEAFLGVWRNAGRYSSVRASVRTWILAIVHHRAIDALRRRRATTDLPDGDSPPPVGLVMPDVWPEVVGRLDREQIRRALESISQSQREAIALAYYGGLTQQEIAARTGTPLGTVKSRVRLGLLALRQALISEVGGSDRAATRERP
jgi:RNA polymerase sigma-70 factor (ECF subfamily)